MGRRSFAVRCGLLVAMGTGASACIGLPPPAPGAGAESSGPHGSSTSGPAGDTTSTGSSSGSVLEGTTSLASSGDPGTDGSESSTGQPPVATLEGLRLELPCMPGNCQFNVEDVCVMDASVTASGTVIGEPGGVYELTIRVRGVVEMSQFANGMLDGPVHVGGDVDSYWLPYRLTVSEPAQTYWLNALGDGDLFTHEVDYTYALPVADGALVSLEVGPDGDGCSLFNHDAQGSPIVVPDIPPWPEAFDGQFLQVDVVSIEHAR